jgi:hypothetical protein
MEEFKVSGEKLKERLKELIREGNVRRVILKNPRDACCSTCRSTRSSRRGASPLLGSGGRGRRARDRLHRVGRARSGKAVQKAE